MKVRVVRYLVSAAQPRDYPPANRPEIAFAGRSNVGKSTLLNALLGVGKVAKVSQTPGKTRLINFFDVDEKFLAVDLPGYGYAKVSQEQRRSWDELISEYLRGRENLRCVLVLVDLRRGLGEMDRQLIEFLHAYERPCVLVFTKADKLKGNARRAQIAQVCRDAGIDPAEALITAAEKREGMEAVWKKLAPLMV